MSHKSTSLKQLLLFYQNFSRKEYKAPSTTGAFRFVLMFKQVYGRPGLWLIDAINFPFPWNHCRDLNEIIRESSSSKCVYITDKSIHKYGRLGHWLSDVFQTSALKLLYVFQQKQVLTKCITSPNQLVFLLLQPNNYIIARVSYWLTRFQFLRNRYKDSNKMLRK